MNRFCARRFGQVLIVIRTGVLVHRERAFATNQELIAGQHLIVLEEGTAGDDKAEVLGPYGVSYVYWATLCNNFLFQDIQVEPLHENIEANPVLLEP